jgi:RHS repeat-associated protein
LPLDVHPNKADSIAGRSNKYIEFTDGDGTTHRFTGVTVDGKTYYHEPDGVHLYLREFSTTDPTKKYALTRPDRVTFFFDSDGYPTGVEDKNGNRLDFKLEAVAPAEDPGGVRKRITEVTDAAGLGSSPAPNRSFKIAYYSKDDTKKPQVRGKIKRITDHTGSELAFDYYEDGNLLRITQRGGTTADGKALGDRSFVFTYTTSSGGCTTPEDGGCPAITGRDARRNPDPKTSPQSSRLFGVFDPRGNETTFDYYGPTSSLDRWKLKGRTDRAGQRTSFQYDITNRVTTMSEPVNASESRSHKYAYDARGHVTKITNPKGEDTLVAWTGDRHVQSVTEPGGALTTFSYNANGYVTDVTDALGHKTVLTYEDLPVDANDVKTGWDSENPCATCAPRRTIPHISQLRTKTSPKGVATASPTDDFQWSFDYDGKGNLTKVTEPEGSPRYTTTYAWNQNGTLASMTDARNNTTTFPTYDASGFATKQVDPLGRVTEMNYDDDGLLRWIQDPLHAAASGGNPETYRTYFFYDSFHRQGAQSTPKLTAANEVIYSSVSFDPNDNVVSERAPDYAPWGGQTTTTSFDVMDRPLLTTGPDKAADQQGERTLNAYDTAGRLTSVTLPKGIDTAATDDFSIFYDYDLLDRVTRETRYLTGSGETRALRTHYCYDAPGDLRRVTKPKAALTTVDCGAAPAAFTTLYDYDKLHRLVKVTDPEGRTKSFGYDPNGNESSFTDAQGTKTTADYDQRDMVTKVIQPFSSTRDVVTKYVYDPVGNLSKLISPRAWDASSDKQSFTDYVTTYTYDAANQLTVVELPSDPSYPQKAFVHHAYDANGNQTSVSLPVATADPAQVPAVKKTVTTYFDNGLPKTIKNPTPTPRVHFDYTAEGWQDSRIPEASGGGLDTTLAMSWDHYEDGQVRRATDRDGQVVDFSYDAHNNLVKSEDSSGVHDASESRLTVSFEYDSLDRVTKATRKKDADTQGSFSSYAYDENSNVATRVDDTSQGGAPGRTHQFTYDQGDWLKTHTDDFATPSDSSDDQKITTVFTPTGWEKSREIAKLTTGALKQTTLWAYALNGKLTRLETKNGAGTLVESHNVSYLDSGIYVNGHRTTDTFFRRRPAGDSAVCEDQANPCVQSYTYDGQDRLRVAREERRAAGTVTTTYDLDPAGNITKQVVDKAGSSTTTNFTYSGEHLKSVTTGGTTQLYFYDRLGRLDCITLEGGTAADCKVGETQSLKLLADYTYDPLDRLTAFRSFMTDGVSSSTKDDEASYVYDALDRLVKETESHRAERAREARTTAFAHIGTTPLVAKETITPSSGSQITKSYAYDAYGHRSSMTKDDGTTKESFTYGYDVHGSTSLLLDASGNPKAAYGYTPYGELDKELSKGDNDEDNPLNPYRYSAKRFDSGSESIDMGARRFAPDSARFLQVDTFMGALDDLSLSSDPLTANRYSLAAGNPVGFVEVDGHAPTTDGTGGAGLASMEKLYKEGSIRGGGFQSGGGARRGNRISGSDLEGAGQSKTKLWRAEMHRYLGGNRPIPSHCASPGANPLESAQILAMCRTSFNFTAAPVSDQFADAFFGRCYSDSGAPGCGLGIGWTELGALAGAAVQLWIGGKVASAAAGGLKWAIGRAASGLIGGATRAVTSLDDAAALVRNARPVGSALKNDAFHRAGSFVVDDIAEHGSVFRIVGADDVQRTLIQMPGEVNGITGRFEWIVDASGNLTHQWFVKGGSINGIPIVP